MMKKILLLCVTTLFLFGCASKPRVVSTFVDRSIPINEHSALTFNSTMDNLRINGMRISAADNNVVFLPPGNHSIVSSYRSQSYRSNALMSITHNFAAGRFYLLYGGISGNSISLIVVDETDPFIWDDSQERGRSQLRSDNARRAMANLR